MLSGTAAEARIERIAQCIPQKVEGEHRHEDRQSRAGK
jgi:hypothetical protein